MSLVTRLFTRSSRPDPATLQAALAPLLVGAGGFFIGYDERAQKVTIEYGDWNGVDTTAIQNAIFNCAAETDRTDAKTFIDGMPLFEKALFLTLLDEVNLIRSLLSPSQPARTPAQWINAAKAKADTL